jgi:hypothetical protein
MNQQVLLKYIEAYKEHFSEISEKEIYKWRVISHFQKHWNIDAEDFHAMLKESIKTTANLLASGNYLARRMIRNCAAQDPERVRAAFKKAYDLETPIAERYEEFKATMVDITSNIPDAKNHYQDHRAFAVYLALRYPEDFYLYKFGMFNGAYQLFDFPLKAKQGAVSNIEKFYSLCEWIKPFLLKDDELIRLHHKRLDKETYQDPAYNLLTQDFIYACVNYEILNVDKANSPTVNNPFQIEELDLADFQSALSDVNLRGRRGIDYTSRNERNQKIGSAAELFVLQHEQEKWKDSKKKNKIEHTSIEIGDGVGYDITSIDEKGREVFIEVKATTGSFKTPFYVTKNEMHASIQDSNKYRLYRVYNFNTTTQTGDIKIFKGSLESICNEPVSYMINLKEKTN